MFSIIISIVLAYLLGSTSGSILVSKLFFKEDIRSKGSGNAGSTNVLRNYGLKFAAISFIIDALKGTLALIISKYLSNNLIVDEYSKYAIYVAGVAVIIGHIWPIFHKFKGGKGMATFVGVNLFFNPLIVLIQVLEALIILYGFKIMSIASIVATITAVIFVLFQGNTAWLIMTVVDAILVIYSHRSNISRLIKGEENKIVRS